MSVMQNTKTHHNVACQLIEYCETKNPLLFINVYLSSREDYDCKLGLHKNDILDRHRPFFFFFLLTSPIKIRTLKD